MACKHSTTVITVLFGEPITESNNLNKVLIHLSIVAGLIVRHGDLSHEMTLSHEDRRRSCDNANRV